MMSQHGRAKPILTAQRERLPGCALCSLGAGINKLIVNTGRAPSHDQRPCCVTTLKITLIVCLPTAVAATERLQPAPH